MLILLSSFASASLTTDIVSYYNFSANAQDSLGNCNGSVTGATHSATGGIIDGKYFFDNSAEKIEMSCAELKAVSGSFSVVAWFKTATNTASQPDDYATLVNRGTWGDGSYSLRFDTRSASPNVKFDIYGATGNGVGYQYGGTVIPALEDNSWHMMIGVFKSSTDSASIYLDGVLLAQTSGSSFAFPTDTEITSIGTNTVSGREFFGNIDEVAIYNRALNDSSCAVSSTCGGEIAELYNTGLALQYPFTFTTNNTLDITTQDSRDNSSISIFNATVNGTFYSTTNGTINTPFTDNTLVNITINSPNYNTYTSLNYNTTNDLTASLIRGKFNVTFQATQLNTGSIITPFNITLENGTTILNTQSPYGIYNDYTTFNFSKTGYYPYELTNQTINTNKIITFSDRYNSLLNLTFKDINTNNTITTTAYFIMGGVTYNATNGTFLIPTIRGNYLNTTSKAVNYAYQYNDLNITDYLQTGSYYLYSENSIWITAKDLSSLSSLSNFTTTLYNSLNIYSSNDTTGTTKLSNITSGTYNVKVEKADYTTVYYIVTIGSGSHQDLTAYLSKTTVPITFSTYNLQSGALLEDVTASIYYLINTTWTLINSKNSDVTGRVQFNVDTSNNYKFNFAKTGFSTKEFLLEPVFTEYTIKLSPTGYVEPNMDQGDYYVKINPSLVYGEQLNNVSFNIVSGTGTLEYYNVTITTPTDSKGGNYSSTYGGSYVYELNVTDNEILDTIAVTYGVKEVGEVYKTYTVLVPIQNGAIYSDGTFFGFKDNTSTMGYFEKGIIATVILLILLGVIASISQMTGGNTFIITGIALVVFAGIFVTVDFLPEWTLYIIGFAFILMLFAKLKGE